MSKLYQERIFLTLVDDSEEYLLIKDILKSPLGLSAEIIRLLFEEDFGELKDKLDLIKSFTAGISRAKKLSVSKYSLALYYPFMFAFHQFVNSSSRARQGKVLEKILIEIIKNYTECELVPEKAHDMLGVISDLFNIEFPKLDIDVLGSNLSKKRTLIIQLRSRDDTGGTTAKESLVDLLREILRTKNDPSHNILYLVCIWEARDSLQKNSTIRKFHSSLREHIKISKEDFEKNISMGIKLRKNITLKLAYGTDEIVKSLYEWSEKNDKSILKSISKVVESIENWDDLWIAYSIANLELEIKSLHRKSNVNLLEKQYQKCQANFNFNSYKDLLDSIDNITTELIANWNEDTIPLNTPADKAHYIRDLLFLRACYEKRK